jgi:hypothetical protein
MRELPASSCDAMGIKPRPIAADDVVDEVHPGTRCVPAWMEAATCFQLDCVR